MTARVLVVDDVPANVKLLETRLKAEYFDVVTANSGFEALDICTKEGTDVMLLDVMMPGMDGFEVCRRMKSDPRTQYIPVVMVTALDQNADRVKGFEAGADDFLSKPVNELALITRVRNLARMKQLTDEMITRVAKSDQGTVGRNYINEVGSNGCEGTIILADDQEQSAQLLKNALEKEHEVNLVTTEEEMQQTLTDIDTDLVIVNLASSKLDGLRLCSSIRTNNRTRHLPLLALSEGGDDKRMLRALDLGVNDYVIRPVDKNELLARTRTQIKRHRFSEFLYRRLDERVEQAARDPLTGMYNRRYMEEHLSSLIKEAVGADLELSVILADIDFFKSINDNFGHDSGDQVIRQFSTRIIQNIRRIDLASRFGGEEFVVILPKTNRKKAEMVGERLRQVIEDTPFLIGDGSKDVKITASLGVTSVLSSNETLETLLKRVDEALYEAKRTGRNKIVSHAA